MKNFFRFLLIIITTGVFHQSISFSQCLIYTFDGESIGDKFAGSLAAAGDVNSDGYLDYIVGASHYREPGIPIGRVYVFSGKTGEVLHVFDGEGEYDRFGSSVAYAGDIDKDGFDDVVIGAITYGGIGRVYVFSGRTGDTIYVFSGETLVGPIRFGRSVATAGDFNLDGYDDLIVGATGYADGGRVFIFSGKTGEIILQLSPDPRVPYIGILKFGYGVSLSSGKDVNQDGFVDVLVGAGDEVGQGSFRAYLHAGPNGDSLHYAKVEPNPNNAGEINVSMAGDVDLDGFIDIMVGAPRFYFEGNFTGRVVVFSGRTGDTIHVFTGDSAHHFFGSSVYPAGDINNDLHGDIVVGAWGYNGAAGAKSGKVYVFSGKTGSILKSIEGEAQDDRLGVVVASGAGFDLIGKEDLIIGATGHDATDSTDGRVYVYSDRGCWGTRGDCNGDGVDANILDLTFTVDRIFRDGPATLCPVEGDVNGDGTSNNMLDLTFLVDRIFRGGPAPGSC